LSPDFTVGKVFDHVRTEDLSSSIDLCISINESN